MNLLLVEKEELAAGLELCLPAKDRRAVHLRKVLRVQQGQQLRAGIVGAGLGTANVVDVSDDGSFRLAVQVTGEPPAASRVNLVLALPRPAVLHRLLQAAATFGVDRLDLVNSWRVEKSFFGSPALEPAAIRRHLCLGAEQGLTTRLPEVTIHKRLLPFLEQIDAADGTRRWLAHPGAASFEQDFACAAAAEHDKFQLAIGPEGGWIDREVESFGQQGFRPVSLGPWVLRVETAVAAAMGQLAMLRRQSVATHAAV